MKRFIPLFLCTVFALEAAAQVPEQSEDVMLQGFYWDSQKTTSWVALTDKADDIARSFTCVWLPPSAQGESNHTVGGNDMGYHPREWSNQNSCFGTSENLITLIAALRAKNVRCIADIVVNHRAGKTGWGDFTLDNFGKYGSYQLTGDHICSTDEINTECTDAKWRGTAKGAADTGENWGGARDLDMTSKYVQQDIIAYLTWLKNVYGYDGWRYDFVKGYNGSYVGMFNTSTDPYISVGEMWDGSFDVVNEWIKATGYKSMAFDFPSKYAALNDGLAKGDYSRMTWKEDGSTPRPAGLIHHYSTNKYAVTFVDNHDSYRDANKYTGDVLQAYAFLLSSPGIPCVFYSHWTHASYKSSIEKMISVRKAVGLHSQCDVTVTHADNKYYECKAKGKRGNLICRIGSGAPIRLSDTPAGYTKVCAGNGWAFFIDIPMPSAKRDIEADAAEEELYSLNGGKVSLQKANAKPGLYIAKSKKGSRKVVIK